MKTSPGERSYTEGGWDAKTLVLPPQSCRRRSLPRLPEFNLKSDSTFSSTDIDPKSPIITETQHYGTPKSQVLRNKNKHYQERRGSHLSNNQNAPDKNSIFMLRSSSIGYFF
jgi:hypothetical protein